MDQSTLVENQIDDGRRFIERFAADGNSVEAAFWAKTAEEGLWFLYVATDTIDRLGPAATYRAIHTSLQKLRESWVAGSEIKVISPSNPIAKDVLAIMARYPGRLATRSSDRVLGSMAVEQTYIYPLHFFTFTGVTFMTMEEISQEIVRLMNRGPGNVQQSQITLKNGTNFNGVPSSLQIDNQKGVVVHFIEERGPAPRVVRVDEIASIA